MGHVHRRARLSGPAGVALVSALGSVADADHGGPLRSAPMDPITVGVLAGLLALAVGVAIALVVRLVLRRSPPAE
jgi:hypothetical protein